MPGSLASRMSGPGESAPDPTGPYGPQNPAPPPPGPPPTGPRQRNANRQNGHMNHSKQNRNGAQRARVKKDRDGRGAARCSKSVRLKRGLKAKKFYDELSEDKIREKYVDEADRVSSAQREGVFQEVDWDDVDGGDQVSTSTSYQQEDSFQQGTSFQQENDESIRQSTETGGFESHHSVYVYENHARGVEDEVDWGDDDEDDAGVHAPPPPAQIENTQAAQPGHVQASQSNYARNPEWDYRTAHAPQSDYSQASQGTFERRASKTFMKQKNNLPSPIYDNIPSSHTSGHYDHYQMQGLTFQFANHKLNHSADYPRRRPGANSRARGSQYEGTRPQQNAFGTHNAGYRDAQAHRTGHHEPDRSQDWSRQGSVRDVESHQSEVDEFLDSGNSYRNQSGLGEKQSRTSPEKVNCPSTVYDLRDYDKQVTALHRGLPGNERFKNGNGKVAPYVYGSVQGYDLGLCFSTFCTVYMCEMGTKCAWRHHPLSKIEREWIKAAKSENGAEFLKGRFWSIPEEPVPGANMHEKQNGMLQGALLR